MKKGLWARREVTVPSGRSLHCGPGDQECSLSLSASVTALVKCPCLSQTLNLHQHPRSWRIKCQLLSIITWSFHNIGSAPLFTPSPLCFCRIRPNSLILPHRHLSYSLSPPGVPSCLLLAGKSCLILPGLTHMSHSPMEGFSNFPRQNYKIQPQILGHLIHASIKVIVLCHNCLFPHLPQPPPTPSLSTSKLPNLTTTSGP